MNGNDIENVATVGDAVKLMNEKHCHPNGFHLFMVPENLIEDPWDEHGAVNHLMRQTYDWRYGSIGSNKKKMKKEYNVKLTREDMEVIGSAMQVYQIAAYTRYLEPKLKEVVERLNVSELDEHDESLH